MMVGGRRMLSRLGNPWRALLAGVVGVALVTTVGVPLDWSATADTGAGVRMVVSAGSVSVVSDGVGTASATVSVVSAPVGVRSASAASVTDSRGCLAITAGVGSIACAIAGGAVAGAVTSLWKTQVTKTEKFSWGGLATSVGMGAVSGFVGGAAGPVLRSVAQSVVSAGAGAAAISAVRAGVQSVLSKTAGVVSTAVQRVGAGLKSAFGGGKTAGNLGTNSAAKTGGTVADTAIHGNSASSPATAYLYRLYDSAGNYLKTGISKNPGTRSPRSFMRDKDMEILQSGSRREMLNLERFIVERDPGPLNHEPWAGAFGWDVP
ncbi:MAG TPA: hypothetical protein VFT01_00480 [Homoserinimonas sp.]|nr:hypothetical protein [Homoserinimonas sp.]